MDFESLLLSWSLRLKGAPVAMMDVKSFVDTGEWQVLSRSQVWNCRVKCKAWKSWNATSAEARRKKYDQCHLAKAPINLRKNSYLTLLYSTYSNPPIIQHTILSSNVRYMPHALSRASSLLAKANTPFLWIQPHWLTSRRKADNNKKLLYIYVCCKDA